ncbi:unnamed protein product, partial [Effrenium voratum]
AAPSEDGSGVQGLHGRGPGRRSKTPPGQGSEQPRSGGPAAAADWLRQVWEPFG